MNTQFITTIFGEERSGIMKSLAQKTNELGGRWIDSRVSHLGGHFAGIIKIEIATDRAQTLKDFISKLEHVNAEFAECNDLKHQYQLWSLTFESEDRAGLIDQISQILSEFAIDIDDMESHRYPIVELGKNVLSAYFALRAPLDFNPSSLSEKLQSIDANAGIELNEL